jgi:hypothetical protein
VALQFETSSPVKEWGAGKVEQQAARRSGRRRHPKAGKPGAMRACGLTIAAKGLGERREIRPGDPDHADATARPDGGAVAIAAMMSLVGGFCRHRRSSGDLPLLGDRQGVVDHPVQHQTGREPRNMR